MISGNENLSVYMGGQIMQINRITWSLMSIETTCLILLTEEVDVNVERLIIMMLELIQPFSFWSQYYHKHIL